MKIKINKTNLQEPHRHRTDSLYFHCDIKKEDKITINREHCKEEKNIKVARSYIKRY